MFRSLTIAALALGVAGTTALAQSNVSSQLKARQGLMRVNVINLGILGAMAKGEVDYNAEAAQAAADSLVGVSMIDQAVLWPEGSGEMDIDGTRAKMEIWDDPDGFMAAWEKYNTAVQAMQAAAGEGQAALGPALGQIGGTCQACHEAYQVPRN
jgi:cytochrome c556